MATGLQPSRIEGRQVLIGLHKRRADGRAKREDIQSRIATGCLHAASAPRTLVI